MPRPCHRNFLHHREGLSAIKPNSPPLLYVEYSPPQFYDYSITF